MSIEFKYRLYEYKLYLRYILSFNRRIQYQNHQSQASVVSVLTKFTNSISSISSSFVLRSFLYLKYTRESNLYK